MLRETKGKRIKNRVRFPGIVEHAAKLGVTRIHLWMVLTGDRESKRLLRRYRELKRQEAVAK